MNDRIFIGIKGTVVALDRTTGTELWRSALTGSEFVNVVINGSDLVAATKGEVFCLDPATGSVRWHNGLSGLGYGFVAIAGASSQQLIAAAEKLREQQAAAGAALPRQAHELRRFSQSRTSSARHLLSSRRS